MKRQLYRMKLIFTCLEHNDYLKKGEGLLMKKGLRKIIAAFVTMMLAMTMSTAVFAADPVSPVNGGDITVNDLDQGTTQSLTAYPIYVVDPGAANGFTVVNDSFKTVTDNWNGAIPKDELSSEVITKLVSASADAKTSYTAVSSNGTATFENLQAGAYLIIVNEVTEEGKNAKYVYNPLVVSNYTYDENNGSIKTDAVTANAKKTKNELKKESTDEDKVVQNGDIITYKITATVPFNKKEFSVTDNIKGAEYYFAGEGSDFTVTDANGSSLGAFTPVTTGTPTEGYDHTFTVDLSALLDKNSYAGQVITITYTAKVTEATSITNIANSSNANDKPTVEVKTGSATITKYGNDENTKLAGAKFALYDETNKKYAEFTTGSIYVTGTWTNTKPDAKSTTQLVTTDANGTATVKGLDVGKYTFVEIVAPEGYSINDGSKITTDTFEITKDNVAATQEATMKDTQMNKLPSTGGRGTLIFTLIGCAVMVVFAASYIRSKKNAR
jgi:fimbrial isopeptide formation D2 family protein/LPXTG-motif cell wall-anchored protein